MALLVYEEGNAIIVPLEIKLEKLFQLEEVATKLRQIDSELPAGAVPRSPGLSQTDKLQGMLDKEAVGLRTGFQGDQEGMIKEGIEKFMSEGVGPEQAVNLLQMSKNPIGFMIRIISNPLVAPVIAAIVVGVILHELFTMRGGVFDLYFKRIIVDELIKGRSRESKLAIRYGLGKSVVITNESGSTVPESSFNSFEAVRSGEMENIKSFQIRKGYRF